MRSSTILRRRSRCCWNRSASAAIPGLEPLEQVDRFTGWVVLALPHT